MRAANYPTAAHLGLLLRNYLMVKGLGWSVPSTKELGNEVKGSNVYVRHLGPKASPHEQCKIYTATRIARYEHKKWDNFRGPSPMLPR